MSDADLEDLLDDGPTKIGVTMMLADSAQVADHKLYILGGGVTAIGPRPQSLAIAMRLEVPWDRANVNHEWVLELVDADGHIVELQDKPIRIKGNVVAGRPAGAQPGTPLPVPLALNVAALSLPAGQRYSFQLSINGVTKPDWTASFATRTAPVTPRPQP